MIRRSESQKEIATALAAFQAEMGVVPKNSTNPFFKSKYADHGDCVKAAAPIHTKHGLSVTQDVGYNERFDTTLTTTLMHTSGEWKESEAILFLSKEDSQAQGSAITYMRRYAYCAVLNLVADDDDDGNAATAGQRSQPSRPARAAEPKYEPFPLDTSSGQGNVRQPPGSPTTNESGEIMAPTSKINQIRKILNEKGVRDEADVLTAIGDAIGRTLVVITELTQVEATQAITELAK